MAEKTLTLGSLFSGSGGFELAGILAGIEPLWSSEVEPFAIRVTTKRMPPRWRMASEIWMRPISPVLFTWGPQQAHMSAPGNSTMRTRPSMAFLLR